MTEHEQGVLGCAVDPVLGYIASVSSDDSSRVWDNKTFVQVIRAHFGCRSDSVFQVKVSGAAHSGAIVSCAISVKSILATGSVDKTVTVSLAVHYSCIMLTVHGRSDCRWCLGVVVAGY